MLLLITCTDPVTLGRPNCMEIFYFLFFIFLFMIYTFAPEIIIRIQCRLTFEVLIIDALSDVVCDYVTLYEFTAQHPLNTYGTATGRGYSRLCGGAKF